MYKPASPYTKIAYYSLNHQLLDDPDTPFLFPDVPRDLYRIRRGCFVSLHKTDNTLRGCIGTIEPQEKNLAEEIRHNALSAAFRDHRFTPLTADEFYEIKISVDVLTKPESISSPEELDPQIYGVIVSDGRSRRGVLLPGISGIESRTKQIQIVKQKAGLSDVHDEHLYFFRFTSNRYH
jgi:AmmeMemoRadiSam system protein A